MKMKGSPQLSVIICTINRIKEIKLCLKSLCAQTNKSFEVIIVDGRKDKKLRTVCKKFSTMLNLKRVIVKKQNLPYQRNIGIKNSRSSIVAFIDDDAIATKNWVQNIINSFKRNKKIIVIGGKILSATDKYIAKFSENLFDYGPKKRSVSTVTGVNLSLHLKRFWGLKEKARKKVFDETLVLAGDDTEMCFYINKLGGQMIYEPEVAVFHFFRTNFVDLMKRQLDYAHGDFIVMTNTKYRQFSLIEDYLIPLNRNLDFFFLPLLLPIIIFKRSFSFILNRGVKWTPLILAKETVYTLGLYFTLLQHAAGRA